MSAAYAIKDHLINWYQGTPENDWVSMGIFTESQHYGVPNELVFSMPVRCKNFNYEVVDGLNLSEITK